MPVDAALVGALHVEYLKKRDLLAGEGHLHHTLFQTSTIEALLEGNYDGDVSFAELGERGDFGLGTLDALDGEMIALDGGFYQVKADGLAYRIDGQTRTPFAVVTFFEPGPPHALPAPTGFADLCARVDGRVGETTACCAVRVDGLFEHVKTRSVPRQHKPYPPLVEVVESQPTFDLRNVEGSLVGFRFPDHARGLNVPGYHFHFITDDRTAGGHVLDCRLALGALRVDREADLRLELPPEVSLTVPGGASEDTLNRVERGQ
ncbi:MAG: Alpha-acetolactate decarboxylase [uncultured Rubrobacteraceae bacterium]|uniref:Alpha-acetolactate decarboxylase n=1 Tax=uncultured Rubrobacteraceae bacterium TaxID=349277 RepID=A0A6J4RZZ5_9ACTN|nr:MAG: Alpha-acetolactate decarboxylase [uncultured Rubrobacteraceae bacterium]